MPRRKPKHLYEPGQSGNPNGRPVGAGNKIVIAERVREAFSQLLDNNVDKLEEWLYAAAKKDPVKALDLWVRISERFVPMLSRTEITGKDGEAFTPITINLPSLPQIMAIGEGTLTEALPLPPGEEIKGISEPNPTFQIPQFTLSPNILRDMEERGEGSSTELPLPGGPEGL